MTKPRTSGRQPRGKKAAGIIGIRVSAEERATYDAAAAKEGLSLSDWLRCAAELAVAMGSTR